MGGSTSADHEGDCGGTFCEYCGCCAHGEQPGGCPVEEAPEGMRCPNDGCGCEGEGYYDEPKPPAPKAGAQEHQETKLFDLDSLAVS